MNNVQVQQKTWLVVEDDTSIRTMLAAMIGFWNRVPLTFGDGFKAMSWLDDVESGKAGPLPELAILDIRMPGPQGHEIAQRLRRLGQTANTPICIMTAFRFDGDERKQINEMASPDLYLAKPLPEPNELRTMLEEIIQKRAGPGTRVTTVIT